MMRQGTRGQNGGLGSHYSLRGPPHSHATRPYLITVPPFPYSNTLEMKHMDLWETFGIQTVTEIMAIS